MRIHVFWFHGTHGGRGGGMESRLNGIGEKKWKFCRCFEKYPPPILCRCWLGEFIFIYGGGSAINESYEGVVEY